jgi:hypothetical protein
MKFKSKSLFIGVTLLLSGTIGCDSGPTVFEGKDGRTISWDGYTITLNNKSMSTDPEKKFVVLENVGSKPSSASPLIFQNATLNKISNKVHSCGGSIQVTENKVEIGVNGSSDRCEMFNGTWYVQGEALTSAVEKGFVPEAVHGKFRKDDGSAAITVNKNIISGTFPEAISDHDRSVEFTLTKGESTSSGATIAGNLNIINGNPKSCSGTIKESNGSVVIVLTGNSSRCSMLSGNWK